MSDTTWDKVMSFKKADKRNVGGANNLTTDEVETIIATIDFFGGKITQDLADLGSVEVQRNIAGRVITPFAPRYRVFDWLAMRVQGRHSGNAQDINATKVLAHSFIKSKGDVDKFIQDLRETDYDVDDSYKNIELAV